MNEKIVKGLVYLGLFLVSAFLSTFLLPIGVLAYEAYQAWQDRQGVGLGWVGFGLIASVMTLSWIIIFAVLFLVLVISFNYDRENAAIFSLATANLAAPIFSELIVWVLEK